MITPTMGAATSLTDVPFSLPEPAGGASRPLAYHRHVIAQNGDVPDLAAGPHLLSI